MLDVFGDELPDEQVEEEFKKPPVPSLFDYLKSINETKVDLSIEPLNDKIGADLELKGFEPYIINKGLGQALGTVGFANLMNRLAHLPKDVQYRFLRMAIPQNRTFAKWAKEDKLDNLKEVMHKLGYSKQKAKEAILVLGEDGVSKLLLEKGGIQRKTRRKK